MVEDFWPEELIPAKIRPPVAILREQAALLGKKTKNLVEGLVTTEDAGVQLVYSFALVAPALGNYKYRLFGFSHDIRMYPVKISLEIELYKEIAQSDYLKEQKFFDAGVKQPIIKANNEEEYIAILKQIFSATKTRQLISAMLAQSST